jgi:NAD+ diphosphatase
LLAAANSGEVLLPGHVSIARRLIEKWYGGALPGTW